MHRMPTVNPRITVTLTAKSAAQLREMASLTGQSQSSMVAEILESSDEIFDRMIKVLRAAEHAKAAIKHRAADDLASAQTKVEAQLGLMLEAFDDASMPLLKDLEKVARRGRASGASGRAAPAVLAPSTPLSNRGVRYTPKTEKNTIKSRT